MGRDRFSRLASCARVTFVYSKKQQFDVGGDDLAHMTPKRSPKPNRDALNPISAAPCQLQETAPVSPTPKLFIKLIKYFKIILK